MRTKKIFQITFGADFCSVTFGTEQEEVNGDPDKMFQSVKEKTERDIKLAMKSDPFIKKIITNAKTQNMNSQTEDEAAELLRKI